MFEFPLYFEENNNYRKVAARIALIIRVIYLMVKIMKIVGIMGLVRLNLMVVTFLVEFKTSIRKLEVMKKSF
jgi:hypothetical protein